MKRTKKVIVPRSQVRRSLSEGQFRTRIEPAEHQQRRISGINRRDVEKWSDL